MSNQDKRRVHVAEIKKTYKGKVHVSTYLRSTFRQDGQVKHETVANISDLRDDLLNVIKNRLATRQPLVGDGGTMTIERSLPHGNVAVEVFPGNTADLKAFTSIVTQVRKRFGITNVVFVER